MTDRQITESSIGLAGRLSHLPQTSGRAEDRGWRSTRNFRRDTPIFKELGPRKIWLPATPTVAEIQTPDLPATTPWYTSRKQRTWLLKAHPEARLGNEYIHDELSLLHSSRQPHRDELRSSLFTIGELADRTKLERTVGAPLVAVAAGRANDVLCLAKPAVEEWQWGDDDRVSLLLAGMGNADSVLWEDDTAGPIRRLKSVVDAKRYDPTRWLILQKDAGTRVFQPEYRRVATTSTPNSGERPSRIDPNPLFFLSKDQTGGNPHSDVSFNPGTRGNPPQLGLIDECGFWSVWDIAHTRVRSRKPTFSLNKCGHIRNGLLKQLPSRCSKDAAEWHKILWIGPPDDLSTGSSQPFDLEEGVDVSYSQGSFPQLVRSSTLLLCGPKSARLLDLSRSSFLPDLPLVQEESQDRILDVYENLLETQLVFILTTLRLFVVRVFSTSGGEWGEVKKGWAVVLSVPHFRNGLDPSLRLIVSPGARSSTQVISQVYIYSTSSSWVDLFCFSALRSDLSRIDYHHEAVVLGALARTASGATLQTLCLYPTPGVLRAPGRLTQSVHSLIQQEVRFFQLAALRTDMSLVSTLCVSSSLRPIEHITRPNRRVRQNPIKPRRKREGHPKSSSYHFIVPVEVDLQSLNVEHDQALDRVSGAYRPPQSILKRPLGLFYEHLCAVLDDQINRDSGIYTSAEISSADPFHRVSPVIERALANGSLPAITLFQMIGESKLYNDTNLGSAAWEAIIESIRRMNPNLVLLGFDHPRGQLIGSTSSLEDSYSMLLDIIGSFLPGGQKKAGTRDSEVAVFREMARDIYLSSLGLVYYRLDLDSSRQLSTPVSQTQDSGSMLVDSQQQGPAVDSSQPQSDAGTTGSKGSHVEISEEDPAMALIRSYTGTGKYGVAKRSKLLEKWTVGDDPADYVFDLNRDEEETPRMQRRARQLARQNHKRRRAESLQQTPWDREPSLPSTQPTPGLRSINQQSQPHVGSSQGQATSSHPRQTMSQPTPGVFGQRPNKRVKKRKGGF